MSGCIICFYEIISLTSGKIMSQVNRATISVVLNDGGAKFCTSANQSNFGLVVLNKG
jgi:hypothetical protein